jgi:hypothetical protein
LQGQIHEASDGIADGFWMSQCFRFVCGYQVLEETVKIFDALFGCWHKNMSFPLSAKQGQRRSRAATQTGTYVVCLDCGREFAYDWKTMRVVSGGGTVAPVHSHIEVEAKAS